MKEIGIFLGCITKAKEEIAPSFESLLKKINASCKFVMDKNCCGAPYLLSGMTKEFEQNAEKFREELEKEDVDTLVLNCPYCHSFIKKRYQEYGVKLGVEILHITTFFRKLIEEGKLNLKKKINRETVYHDPCYLGRQGEGIYEDPREVLKAGVAKLVEFELSKEEITCCGGNSSIVTYLPHLFTEVSREKINMQVIPLGAEVLTTACPHCYFNFSNANKDLQNPIEVKHIVQILDEIT